MLTLELFPEHKPEHCLRREELIGGRGTRDLGKLDDREDPRVGKHLDELRLALFVDLELAKGIEGKDRDRRSLDHREVGFPHLKKGELGKPLVVDRKITNRFSSASTKSSSCRV